MIRGVVECPKCGKESRKPTKEWAGGARTRKPMRVQRFVCASCGTSYVGIMTRRVSAAAEA